MNKFLTTVACAVTMLAVLPACAKKAVKQEPVKTEQVEASQPVHKEVSNEKENYTV